MSELQDSLVELIRRTSAEIPDDVHQAILTSLENEKKESLAANAMKIIDQNIALAKNNRSPSVRTPAVSCFTWIAPSATTRSRSPRPRAKR